MRILFKILVVAPSWVGDAVLAQPLFKRLRERHCELTLDVLAPPWTFALFARMPEINSSIDSPFGHGELALKRRYALGRRLTARHYDQAIVLPNSWKSALIPCFAGIPLRTGFVGEARWGLLNDTRGLDETALPLMAERFALLAEATGDAIKRPLAAAQLKVDHARRPCADSGLIRGGQSRRSARAPNTAPPSAGRPSTSPSSRRNSRPPAARCGSSDRRRMP